MKFDLLYELQTPKPHDDRSEYRCYQEALEQIELADKLGFDTVWFVEHHFLTEFAHSSAPETFLGALTQRTKNIRLGCGVSLLPYKFNHPIRVAERVAALDLLSNGRVEFGTGESASITELEPFGVTMDGKREIWEDAIRCLIPMFADGGVAYHGPHFDFPLRNVLPKPRQKPHPPLWMACSQLETIAYAGRRGLGALGFQFVSADAAHAWVHAYYNNFTKHMERLADYKTNPNIALVSMFMCAETDEEARAKADGATFFQFCLRFYGNTQDRKRPAPGEVDMWEEYLKWKQANPDVAAKALAGGLIGSPETIRRKLRKFESSHIDQVILLNQAGRNSHADICSSLEMFASDVMPEFHANIPAQDEWKRQVLAREIELEEIDTDPFKARFGAKAVEVRAAD